VQGFLAALTVIGVAATVITLAGRPAATWWAVAAPGTEYAVFLFGDMDVPDLPGAALEALGQLHQARPQPAAAAPLIAEAQELRQALFANAR